MVYDPTAYGLYAADLWDFPCLGVRVSHGD